MGKLHISKLTEDIDEVVYLNGVLSGHYFILRAKNRKGRDSLKVYDEHFHELRGYRSLIKEYKKEKGITIS